ncbi:MAG: hypothetical protein ACJAZB_001305 [Psychrosphaera sp.]|jgi:hypothetical protein|uniref:Uncharacterized protein n=1 Tax=Psychrosphaera aquimarina TaxID=2044854 RepID=A0ABU3R1U2_9GAMM|nr:MULTISPECIES: hypothetical protein [Psychrosphaera]MBU2916956.1 hypothetical protein [Psychrosphaera sp. F3M07]MDU0113647.1 hypothetical protein [Psychrosphaera aquimarina]
MAMKKNTKSTLYILALLTAALIAMYEWSSYLSKDVSYDDLPEFNQCEKVFVGKIPYACNQGELIYVDEDVADEFCTDKVFVRANGSVYCEYNGNRPDRTRPIKQFNTRNEKE